MSGGGPGPEVLMAVLDAVAERSGLDPDGLEVVATTKLSGGASRLTWMVDVAGPEGTTEAGVVVQLERPGSAGANLSMARQADLVAAAGGAGVPVPEVLASGDDGRGAGFAVLERLEGESLPARILGDDRFAEARAGLAVEVGRACARIHTVDPAVLGGDATGEAPDPLAPMVALLDALGEPHPAFEIGLRWLESNRPPTGPARVVHGDLRMGNLLVDTHGLTGVLDWELAHLGSPVEDLGWFCARAWRFGSPERAGGTGSVEDLLEGYRSAGGDPPTPEELDWWEAYACLRWGLICLLQASVHLSGSHRSVELAAIGRRADECEEDLLEIVSGSSAYEPPGPSSGAAPSGPHGRPSASELLEAVGEHLEAHRGDLEGAERFHMRVAHNVVSMVRREIDLAEVLRERHRERLDLLGVRDDAELASRIRAGALGSEDAALVTAVRESVRDKLAVSHPGYWLGDPAAGTPA